MGLTRRNLLLATSASLIALASRAHAQTGVVQTEAGASAPVILTAKAQDVQLLPEPAGKTTLYNYTGAAPLPVIRGRQGQMLLLRLANELPVPTSLYWHGVRLPAASAAPVSAQPGQGVDISFTPQDAGVFLYRAGINASEQAERGLVGALIIEEATPPADVDQDIVLLLKDVLLEPSGRMNEDFERSDKLRMGRLGNVLTVNGVAERLDLPTRLNQRVRLRLLNGSTGRILPVRIEAGVLHVLALDGQPCEPFQPADNVIVLAPGNRADVFVQIDSPEHAINAFIDGQPIPVARLLTGAEPAQRDKLLPPPLPLPPNPGETKLDLAKAKRVPLSIVAQDGAQPGKERWQFYVRKGTPATQPLFKVARGTSVVLQLDNFTPVPHAIHVEGHRLRPLDKLDDGWKPWMLDTILLFEQDTQMVGFVADNPGKWQITSSILAHQASGMTTWFEVV